jgi:hypothetical protein
MNVEPETPAAVRMVTGNDPVSGLNRFMQHATVDPEHV